MPQEGMLLQLDGSHHRWLENRGPWLTLFLAVDDATGTIPYALFREQEDTLGYFELLKVIINHYGIPLGVYTDRNSIFHVARSPSNGAAPLTQFGRALRELGITHVLAHSPEAKGRVERAHGTFQDRLVAELRLSGASNSIEANSVLWDFLPRFNQRFGVPATQLGQAYRSILGLDLEGILCIKERRRVARDNTVQYRQRNLQLFPDADKPSYAGAQVEIQERLGGQILACYKGKILTPQDAPPLAATLRTKAEDIPEYPALWKEPKPTKPSQAKERRHRNRTYLGPLAGDTIWWEDPVRKNIHSELTRAGLERARQAGKRVTLPKVEERDGFAERFAPVLEQLERKAITRQQAAKELGISGPTLKRILDDHIAATRRALGADEERAALVV
jgi:hypothetical protein